MGNDEDRFKSTVAIMIIRLQLGYHWYTRSDTVHTSYLIFNFNLIGRFAHCFTVHCILVTYSMYEMIPT